MSLAKWVEFGLATLVALSQACCVWESDKGERNNPSLVPAPYQLDQLIREAVTSSRYADMIPNGPSRDNSTWDFSFGILNWDIPIILNAKLDTATDCSDHVADMIGNFESYALSSSAFDDLQLESFYRYGASRIKFVILDEETGTLEQVYTIRKDFSIAYIAQYVYVRDKFAVVDLLEVHYHGSNRSFLLLYFDSSIGWRVTKQIDCESLPENTRIKLDSIPSVD